MTASIRTRLRSFVVLATLSLALLAVGCQEEGEAAPKADEGAAPEATASGGIRVAPKALVPVAVQVGIPEACPPDVRCAEADRFLPAATAVLAGEPVRFDIRAASHQVAIYGPDVHPATIEREPRAGILETPGANNVIASTARRVGVSPQLPFGQGAVMQWDWDTTGVAPGTYTMICTFIPHLDVGMFGYIVVQ